MRLCCVTERAKQCSVKTTAARASWNVIATEYQVRSGDQLLSWRIATLSGRTITINPVSQNSGQYCYSTDGKTLICDKDFNWTPINIEWEDGQRCTYVCTEYDEKEGKKCLEWHIECHQSAPSCEWECTGGSGVTVSWVTLGWYCRYVTQELLDMLDSDKATFFDLWSITTENGWIQCTFTGWSSSSPQSITINWTPDNICVKVNDNTINCNIPLEDLQGGTWTTEGSWLWTSNSTQTVIYPASYTKSNVAIWTNTSNNYTLNVNWSWRIASKFNVWDNFWILSGQRYMIYTQTCNTNNARYATSPTIRYNDTLAFRDNDLLQCSNWYTEIGDNGSMWIGWPSESANTKLSVYWHTRIYSTASDSDQFIDLYTTNYWESHIESKWREMRVWLTWTINWWWNPTYLYFKYWSIGVNKTPVANSTSNWTVNATLQINGWIQISNNSTISNSSPSTNCGPAQAWMIQYYSWNFYGCNGSVWKKFDMSSLQAWGTQIWSGVK